MPENIDMAKICLLQTKASYVGTGVNIIQFLYCKPGEDALIYADIIVDPGITVSEGRSIGNNVRNELNPHFDE